ncbi:hypothetical protein J4Q44_G00261330 [Coregonus suidteri]|uniref:B30.2/SPRY domain-containing protein n=1 Tax=Coregonus suidteri TaxID=861788 RepID=A0AAN8QFF3_9TELE
MTTNQRVPVPLVGKPDRVGILLDYEAGLISLVDIPKAKVIHSLRAMFRGPLCPALGFLHLHFSHLADALIQSDLQLSECIHFHTGPPWESNPQPRCCKRHALPTELHPCRPFPPLPWTTLANCAPPHGSPGRGRLRQSGFKPGSLVAQIALRCSALHHCATREACGMESCLHTQVWGSLNA